MYKEQGSFSSAFSVRCVVSVLAHSDFNTQSDTEPRRRKSTNNIAVTHKTFLFSRSRSSLASVQCVPFWSAPRTRQKNHQTEGTHLNNSSGLFVFEKVGHNFNLRALRKSQNVQLTVKVVVV